MAEISVIMSVYNTEKYLVSAVKSILEQTFSDFEFLICDDCSTDASWEILQDLASRDNRIKLFRNEKNQGPTVSRNKLQAVATAPLIAVMDADDIAFPDRLAKQYEFMQKHPHIGIAGGQLEIIDETDRKIGTRDYHQDADKNASGILCSNPLAHPSVIMRKEVIDALGGYHDIHGCEDYDLWLRAVDHGFAITNLPDRLLRYRISSGQIKQRYMKGSLRSTIALQKQYLLKRKFFSFKALFYFFAEHLLLLLPNKFLLKLFMYLTYKK